MVGDTVIIAGSVAQRPHHGGHAWVFLQYLLGFRRLGWEVLFVDRVTPDMCVDRQGRPAPFRESENLRYLAAVMDAFDLRDSWTLLCDDGGTRDAAGRPYAEAVERARRSAFLLNVMG